MEAIPREIVICQTADGREPFSEWMHSLDPGMQAIVMIRMDRVEEGSFGAVNPVGGGVSELVFDNGPGYRVYFGQIGYEVHLISGGSKKKQQRDIEAAKKFWRAHD